MDVNPPPIREAFTINGYIAPAWVIWFNQLWRFSQTGGGGGGVSDGNKGDITVSGGGTSWSINSLVVSTAKMGVDVTTAGKAMLTAASAAAQTALLNVFTSGLKGLVPPSGGGTTNYLRADGTWAAPTATVSDGDKGDITVSSGGTVWTIDSGIIPTIQEATIDFGAYGETAIASVADTSVTSNTKILLTLKNDPTRDGDELEMAPMTLGVHVTAGVGFDIYANALQGANGQFKVNYMKV